MLSSRKKALPSLYSKLIIFFLILLSLVSIGYQYLMLPNVLEKLVIHVFEKYSAGEIRLTIKKASLFYGFEIENCHLRLRNTKEELLSFKSGRFSTFLPALLAGEASVRDLTLKGGRLRIHYKKGRWNWGRLFNPHEREEQEEEEQEDTEVPDKIDLFFPLRLHAKLDLQNFSYYMEMDKEVLPKSYQRLFALRIEGIDLKLGLITRTFTEIDLSLEMAHLFDSLSLSINPKKAIRFAFQSQGEIKGLPKLKLFVFREKHGGDTEFHSRFLLDTHDLGFTNKKGKRLELDWQAFYDIFYASQADRLVVNSLELRHKKKPWFLARAAVNHVSSTQPSLQLDIEDAHIDLERIGELIAVLGASPKAHRAELPLGGKINIARLSLFGALDNLKLKSKFKAQSLVLNWEKEHRIRDLLIDLDARIDIHEFVPLQEQSRDHQVKVPLALGIFRYLRLRQFEILHERGYLKAEAHISAQEGTRAEISLDDCDLGFFTENIFGGRGNAQIKLHSSGDFTKTNFDLDLLLRNAVYTLQRSRSQPLHLNLGAQGNLDFQKGVKLELTGLKINGKNLRGQNLLRLRTQGALSFAHSGQSYFLKKSSLSINAERLYPTLPRFLGEMLAPFRAHMANKASKTLALSSSILRFQNTETKKSFLGEGHLEIPALNLTDIDFSFDIQIGDKQILFRKGSLTALRGALAGRLQGKVEKRKKWEPNVNAAFRVFKKAFVPIHENIFMQGELNLKAKLLPKKLQASIDTKNLNFEFLSGDCKTLNKAKCKSLSIQQVVLDNLEIEHLWEPHFPAKKSLRSPQNNYKRRSGDTGRYNFRIGRIASSHNPRGEYIQAPKRWHYLGRPPIQSSNKSQRKFQKKPGLQAALVYRNNALSIDRIEIDHFVSDPQKSKAWRRNGIIRGKDIYFSLFDLKPKNMGASWKLKIQNLDLEPFLPPSRSNYDGIISADFSGQISGFGGDILEKIRASLIVHQISPEFGGFITRILVPIQVIAFLVRNTLEVPSIKVKLRDGLAYSYIQVQRARIIPGVLLSSASEEIKQERIPIAQFLKRAQSKVHDLTISSKKYPKQKL